MSKLASDLRPAFKKTLDALVPRPPRKILLAVSGGPDSMALWDLMERWRAAHPDTELVVGHVNHGLRGRASDGDAAFVAKRAKLLGTKCRVERVPTKSWSRRHKRGIEESARILRYRALSRMARAEKCSIVLAAHTLDDQVETVFMNLIRGAGPGGLAAMAPSSVLPVKIGFQAQEGTPVFAGGTTNHDPRLLRPLLDIPKTDILRYLRRRKMSFRLDNTNRENAFFRNRLRPMLRRWEKWRPGFFKRVSRLAALQRVEEDFWREYLSGPFRRVFGRKGGTSSVDRAALGRYPLAVQRRLLRRAGLTRFDALEKARLSGGAGPSGRGRRTARPSKIQAIPVPGHISWRDGDGARRWLGAALVRRLPSDWKRDPRRAYLDADAVDVSSLHGRFWRAGDRFRPLGMGGSKKLSDFFADAKVPAEERGRVLLVADARGILWLAGHRPSERARIAPATRRILHLRVH